MILKRAVDINFWLGPKNNTFFSTIMTHVNSSRRKTWGGGVWMNTPGRANRFTWSRSR